MTLLQVCNVGRIVGGTAACAWSIARALPDVVHHVAFLSGITDETRQAFAGLTLHRVPRVTQGFVRELGCDSVILHNVSLARSEHLTSAWTLQYVHSRGTRAPADATRYCSRWLADQCLGPVASEADVFYQGVPCPIGRPRPHCTAGGLVVGRICTPTPAKWPPSLIDFYAALAGNVPGIDWEFVGCPEGLRPKLDQACRGRAAFHPAGWDARSHLARWDVLLYHHPTITESFGRTAAEAMRAGCIPVVDGRGGFVEQVTSDTGYMCDTVTDFMAALLQLQDPALRNRMASKARERGDRLFSLRALRQRLLRLWKAA